CQTFLPFLDARSALDRQYLGEASVTCKHAAYLTCHNTALYTCVYTSKLTCVSPHGLRRTDAYAKPETGCLTQRLAETSEEWPTSFPLWAAKPRSPGASASKRIRPGSDEGMVDLLQPERPAGRQHPVVCLLLGILRPLLRGAFWRRMASLSRAFFAAACRKYSRPNPGRHLQPKRNQQQDRSSVRHFDLRPEAPSPAAALVRVSETLFTRNPIETRVVLASVRDGSELLRRLLDGGHSVRAGRLAGAFRRIDRPDVADEIVATMKAAGYDVRESDPFAPEQILGRLPAAVPPIIGRIRTMWESMREKVLEVVPQPPGLPQNVQAYLQFIDEIYRSDAYHSLSIEGYRVSPELIERVREGNWDPDIHNADGQSRDALAVRGYWQACNSSGTFVDFAGQISPNRLLYGG